MSEWISVDDSLPEDGSKVLAMSDGDYVIAIYSTKTFMHPWFCEGCGFCDVDAWMPLPEPYREQESDMDKEMTLTERIRLYADGDPECGVQPHGFDFSHEDAENMMSALRLVWLISREDCAHNFQHEREDLQDYIRVMNAMIKIAKNFVNRCPMRAEFRLRER